MSWELLEITRVYGKYLYFYRKMDEEEGKFSLTGDLDNMKHSTKDMEVKESPEAETNGKVYSVSI